MHNLLVSLFVFTFKLLSCQISSHFVFLNDKRHALSISIIYFYYIRLFNLLGDFLHITASIIEISNQI